MMKTSRKLALATVATLASPLALAHGGHEASGFVAGVLHPLTGLDHLAMLLGVGALGALQGARQRTGLYGGALVAMLGGAMLGLATGWGQGVEPMILLSLFVVAAGFWLRRSSPVAMVASLAMLLFHGWAHGLEVAPAQVATFLPGMLAGTALVLVAGFALGRLLRPKWLGAGSGTAAVAIALLG